MMPTFAQRYDAIVIGGGAAGMMTTLIAARRGRHILLLEKMHQPGLKLRITGKGRCNLTNTATLRETLPHIAPNPRWLYNTYSRFFNTELMAFFESLGVPLVEERGGRVFPKSGRSIDIFHALISSIEAMPNVDIRKNCAVNGLKVSADDDTVEGVRLQSGEVVYADSVVVATGGMSYPSTGSTGAGYIMARSVGHSVADPVPALVPLHVVEPLNRDLSGNTLKNVRLMISREDGKKIVEYMGELAFSEDALTGPISLSASRDLSRRLHEGEVFKAHIDLKPALTMQQLDLRLQRDIDANGTRLLHDAMRMWLPEFFVAYALQVLRLPQYKRLHQITSAERHKVGAFLKDVCLTIDATNDFSQAIITQGGVDTKEVDPKTMQSKLRKGLFFVGEVLNLDADTGGYNLQIAFSTGVAAGENI